LAVTVIGHDRPGIIADVAEVLAGLGMNLTDSTMTRLRGHFAMTLICTGDPAPADVEAALGPLAADGTLDVAVRRSTPNRSRPTTASRTCSACTAPTGWASSRRWRGPSPSSAATSPT
jgi:glycine cleavage system transcriptional repressor